MTAACALPPGPRGTGKKRGCAMGSRRGLSGPACPHLPPPAARPWLPGHGEQLPIWCPVFLCHKVRLIPYTPPGNLPATDFLQMTKKAQCSQLIRG